MLSATTPAHVKRARFREALAGPSIVRMPGAFNALSAMLVERHGFEGVYLSGSVISTSLGLPDIGLTSLTEVAGAAQSVTRSTELPVLVDADTGFGEPMNAARTVQSLEDAGVAGLHIEDQVNPKRCGHLDGKAVVGLDVAVSRIRAACEARRDENLLVMARTDVRAVDGLDAAVDRAKALVDAGADAVFPEAMASLAEFEAVCAAVDVPVLANMTEFGKSELFSVQQLQDAGVSLVIFPVSLLRLAMGAADRALGTLAREGSLRAEVGSMQTRADQYDLLDYAGYAAFDDGVYTFSLEDRS